MHHLNINSSQNYPLSGQHQVGSIVRALPEEQKLPGGLVNTPAIVKNRFIIKEELGQGGYGSVCKAFDNVTNENVAIKFNKKLKSFKQESAVMEQINKFKFRGFPKLISYGIAETQNYIVTELLGPTLKQTLADQGDGPFSLETVCLIGLQLAERLENLHSIGYLHLDIKPNNVLLGTSDLNHPKSKLIYLIDFGITKKYKETDGSHVPFKIDVPFTGNIIFSSVNTFLGYELSRRDDMESLIYLLTYLAVGNLPWICLMSAKSLSVSSHLIKQQKIAIRGQELCKDLPPIFANLFNYVRGLAFDQKPDYSYIKRALRSVIDNTSPSVAQGQYKPVFDWHKTKEQREEAMVAASPNLQPRQTIQDASYSNHLQAPQYRARRSSVQNQPNGIITVQSAVKGVEEVKRERERDENKKPEVAVVPNANASRLNEIAEIPSGSQFSRRSSLQDQLMRMDGELIPDNYENPRVGGGGAAQHKSQNRLNNPTPKLRRRQLAEGQNINTNLNVASGSGISQSRGLGHPKKFSRKTQLNNNSNNIGVDISQNQDKESNITAKNVSKTPQLIGRKLAGKKGNPQYRQGGNGGLGLLSKLSGKPPASANLGNDNIEDENDINVPIDGKDNNGISCDSNMMVAGGGKRNHGSRIAQTNQKLPGELRLSQHQNSQNPNFKKKISMHRKKTLTKKKILVSIKDATIFEASNIGGILPSGLGGIQNSFEIEFDSSELDDYQLNEGLRRPQEEYQLFCHPNFLRQVKFSLIEVCGSGGLKPRRSKSQVVPEDLNGVYTKQ
ncbi:hypothetical protein FGO68_gene17084 [Halteria grandinella]|uniref:Casein kinase I n=1 Tax=Halteria grandinella TaxID=5974 RepID=A0A8J8P784_HALGN|nr:hypothetical protein FGO68_gene17084 [Halteria grandinella]